MCLLVGIVCHLIVQMLWFRLTTGRVILEAAILTAGVAVGLTLYTFWAAKRVYDFNFLGPFLSAAIFVVILFCLLQVYTIAPSFPFLNPSLPALASGFHLPLSLVADFPSPG